jgi:hypothetical protein
MEEELSLHDALYNSYANDPNGLQKTGFTYDNDLSNGDEQVYYNKNKKKLLFTVTGTHKPSDIGTDLLLGLGQLKSTQRYKNAEIKLQKAKFKYNNPENVTIAGSSLGGAIASKLSGSRILTYNKPSLINEKVIAAEKSYRKSGDVVSLLNPKSNTKTIHDPKGLYIPAFGFNSKISDALHKHQLSHLKNQDIYI